ncbi:MAG: NAD(P)H-dependent oxidoreductase [Bacillota bacterium]
MKTLLFINGCVRGENSRTLQMAKAYLETRENQGEINIVERNLNNSNLSFLSETSFDSTTGQQKSACSKLAEEFASADEILLAAPYWEFLFPAVVSCYFEAVSLVGKTFKYTQTGSVGLCKAESFKYIYSAGDFLCEDDKLSEKYLEKLSKLYGITNFSAILADGLDIDGNDAVKIVKDKCDQIRNNL